MSLDISLKTPMPERRECVHCGSTYDYRGEVYEANITHNLTTMADAAGVYKAMWRPEEIGVTTAGQLVDLLRAGLDRLLDDPDRFKQFNPENGWGDYEGLVRVVTGYLRACEQYPDAIIEVSR